MVHVALSGKEIMQRRQRIHFGSFNKLVQIDPFIYLMRDLTVSGTHGDNRYVFKGPQKGSIGGARHTGINRALSR